MADDAPQTEAPATTDTEQKTGMHDGKPVISVKVYAPFKVYFEGEAYSVSAVNETGPFDILPHHHKFLCMLVPCKLKIDAINGPQEIKLNRALMHVNPDSVTVFVDV